MSKNLKQWKNTLNSEQIAHGMNVATANAVRLLKDAELLFQAGSFPTACSIAILAIEEAGKISILRELSVARDGKDVKEAWRSYRSHTHKNVLWMFPSLVQSGNKTLDSLSKQLERGSEATVILDDLKQIGFYTDCLGNRNWSVPDEIIDKSAATDILEIARILCSERTYSKKEVDLWVKHMKPVKGCAVEIEKQALNNWFIEMQANDLIKEHSIKFSDFIGENDL
ncbi:AbiV family abortive infection protein [Vibrio chagasii]|nr:AbiV family abortive infection protein [Vibrio chagasii]CAH7213562.1 AbiV family abortive infection protein [Vibrio chagasii]CAH7403264.1 AbiV family abortive infection protein [Vibrio chagasii]CAH7403327.1 AbiV family abortive infection protein [Vibrio chagasii]